MQRRVVGTSLGDVEVAVELGRRPAVLLFPGGHCTAMSDIGWDLLRGSGMGIVSVSRPGYGATRVGRLSAAEFVPAVEQVCAALGLESVAAAVGVSFGGMPAVHLARSSVLDVERLLLCSAAPSSLPYPDSRAQRTFAPMVFAPGVERLTWAMTSALVRTDRGLRAMVAQLSTRPVEQWWAEWTPHDKERARGLFTSMASGSGFVNDLRQAGPDTASQRRWSLSQVACPALVMGSRFDGGVAFGHAEDLAAHIPGARLVETGAASHLFWLGPTATAVGETLDAFLHEPAG